MRKASNKKVNHIFQRETAILKNSKAVLKKENIAVLKIIKIFSSRKKILLGARLICGNLKIGKFLYTKDLKSFKIKEIHRERISLEEIHQEDNYGLLLEGKTKLDPGEILFGEFIRSNNIKGKYTEIELYWIKHCGKSVKNKY